MKKEQNWEILIKQFMKRASRMSVIEFCRKHNVTAAELQSHYKQERSAEVGEIVEVKPYRKKNASLLLDINGVRIKVTPDTDKLFLKDIITLLRSC
ncbi:hypothetical protein L0P73_19425 [[Clostridium] innocuum]|uniref:IS66 family insertion sequence element accessory protein TnpA n=1 Tax=Clostridium innocuum TaxID=1522 RepID=UPI001EE08DDB|nr:hypothetical protein [[Clostridium] innocuum]MCG4662748.1 hypothetical protein [[Clostridium] innocuum]MCR0332731.1 hypothetical protein [[Clostridium] innocuum]